MRLILYGTKTDRDEFMCSVTALPDLRYRKMQITGYLDYDSFITGLGESPPGVIAAKSVCKNVPVLWFSNDNGFGAQSYRLGCAYFHKKPVSPQILSAAIARCV